MTSSRGKTEVNTNRLIVKAAGVWVHTLLSMWATGWTEVALMMPRKTITRYSDPNRLFTSCSVLLQHHSYLLRGLRGMIRGFRGSHWADIYAEVSDYLLRIGPQNVYLVCGYTRMFHITSKSHWHNWPLQCYKCCAMRRNHAKGSRN